MFANLPPCLIGMEACSGAHYWARELIKLGHDPRIMAPKFVIPYPQNEKNDANDAEAICEAVGRPKTRFVSIKSPEQQAVLCLHRIRQGVIKSRTATINQLRGLLSEFGIVISQGRFTLQNSIDCILEDYKATKEEISRRSTLQRVALAAYGTTIAFIIRGGQTYFTADSDSELEEVLLLIVW